MALTVSKKVKSDDGTSQKDETCLDVKSQKRICSLEKVNSIRTKWPKWKGNTHTGVMVAKENRWKQSEQWEVEEEELP